MVTKEDIQAMQDEVDKLFKENGYKLTDDILDKQIAINELRNKHDIPDEKEFIYKEFVQ